jgi:hypothetical protein
VSVLLFLRQTFAHSKAFRACMLLAGDKYTVTDVVPPLSFFNCRQPLAAPGSHACGNYSCSRS